MLISDRLIPCLFQIYILQEYSNFDTAASYVGLVEKVHIHPQYK